MLSGQIWYELTNLMLWPMLTQPGLNDWYQSSHIQTTFVGLRRLLGPGVGKSVRDFIQDVGRSTCTEHLGRSLRMPAVKSLVLSICSNEAKEKYFASGLFHHWPRTRPPHNLMHVSKSVLSRNCPKVSASGSPILQWRFDLVFGA